MRKEMTKLLSEYGNSTIFEFFEYIDTHEFDQATDILRSKLSREFDHELFELPVNFLKKKPDMELARIVAKFYNGLVESGLVDCEKAKVLIGWFCEVDGLVPYTHQIRLKLIKSLTNNSNGIVVDLVLTVLEAIDSADDVISTMECFEWIVDAAIDLQPTALLASKLVQFLCNPDLPVPPDMKKQDFYTLIYSKLGLILVFHDQLSRQQQDLVISTILAGFNKFGPKVTRICINLFHIACYQFKESMTRNITHIILKISQTTARTLSPHVLELLSVLAKHKEIAVNFSEEDYKRVLAIALQMLHHSAVSMGGQESGHSEAFVFNLSYHVVTNWFLCLRPFDRQKLADFILHFMSLPLQTSQGNQQAIDMFILVSDMLRHYLQFEEAEKIALQDLCALKNGKIWHLDHVLLAEADGKVLIRQSCANRIVAESMDSLLSKLTLNTPEKKPVLLDTGSEAFERALKVLDRIPDKEYHKIAVFYVKNNQSEVSILKNQFGSPEYFHFLHSLGSFVKLLNYKDFTGGLDTTNNLDGEYMLVWKDLLYQTIFHVTTLIPSIEHDENCNNKKRHTGNDFCSLLFFEDANANVPFDIITSQFSQFHILIWPVSGNGPFEKMVFKVEMRSRPDIEGYGPLQEIKYIQGEYLGAYIRDVALHANMFARDAKCASNPRERLLQIRRIIERHSIP